ncbi:MAG: acyl-CoA dehydrogenase family protein [Candidatus Bathyarchaeia archaeon]
MDFSLSEEEKTVRKSVSEFCETALTPHWIEMDEKGELPVSLISQMAEQGLVGSTVSTDYGGAGSSLLSAAIAAEQIAYSDPSLGSAVYVLLHNAWPYLLQKYGTQEAKEEILPRITAGEAVMGIWSTEAQGGSDVAGIRTLTAERKNKTWILNGEKSMVSFPDLIEKMPWGGGAFLIARTGDVEQRHKTITTFAFMARRGGGLAPGFEWTVLEEIGRHSVKTGPVRLKSVNVDQKYVIGKPNEGFRIAMEGFNLARCLIGVATIGAAKWVLDQGVNWIKERKVRGRPLSNYQGVSFPLADLHANLEAARLVCYNAAQLGDRYIRGDSNVSLQDVALASASAKLTAPQVALEVCQEVMKWFGGAAYFKDVPAFRVWRSIMSYVVGAEGTQNVMRQIISRNLLDSNSD